MSTASWTRLLIVAVLAGTPVSFRTGLKDDDGEGNRPIFAPELLEEQDRIAATLVAGGSHRMDSPSAPLKPPPRFPNVESNAIMGCMDESKWEIDPSGRLSKGEYGVVYSASSTEGLEQNVVVKVMRLRPKNWMGMLRGSAATLDTFEKEIAAQNLAAEMDLAVPIYDYFACGQPGEEPTFGFIFMGLVQGMTLERWINRHAEPSQDSDVKCTPTHHGTRFGMGSSGFITGDMYTALLKGIPKLDKKGLITSDLHTANIMVDTSGPREKWIFIDFGLAYKYEHKNGQAVNFALSKFGCPVPETFKDVNGFEAKHTAEFVDEDLVIFDD